MKRQHETITLLPAEQLLRQLLLDCRDDMLTTSASSKLEIWFTGGWVRDKLLGVQSSDIDAALSTMTGMQFGSALQAFFSRHGGKYRQEAERLGVSPDFKGLHMTALKPDKSKHLETGTARIFGLDLDLVNLRGETYTEDSRNPQVEFSTVEEDALRRDATVNALFYNLDKQQVEDFTGKGLQDMAAGIIRTPLDPHKTFMDDPLRVLRVIRFASRLGYTIDDEAKQAMKDERIHAAFNTKISRERVGTELFKMINGRNPLMAFQLIYEMNLYSTVFLNPAEKARQILTESLPHQEPDYPWPSTWSHAYRILAALLEDKTSLGIQLAQSDGTGEHCWIMAAYAPIAALRCTRLANAIKEMTEAIKATNKTSKLLEAALKHMDDILLAVNLVESHNQSESHLSRSTIGMAIRYWGPTWRLQVLYSLLAEVVYDACDEDFFAAELGRYSKFLDFVQQQRLEDAALIKPILKGDDVLRLFNLKKSGAFIKTALDGITKWQFDHEQGSKDEAREWLLLQREEFGIP